MSTDDDLVLADALALMGGSALTRCVAKFLPNDTYELSFEMAIPRASVVSVATSLLQEEGELLSTKELSRTSEVQGLVGAGFFNMNPTLVDIFITDTSQSETHIRIQGKAKEGLIKQHAGRKAAQRVARLLLDQLLETS